METRLNNLEEKLDMIDTKVSQMVDAILGNPLTKMGGIVQDIEVMKVKIAELERKQQSYDEFKRRVYWTIGILGFFAVVGQYIANMYYSLKK